MKIHKLALLIAFLMLTTFFGQAQARTIFDIKNPLRKEPQAQQMQVAPMPQEAEIGLQHPYSRQVAYCYSNPQNSAEACARYFEKNGYVRFKDIPFKTANFDFLQVDTFPTRRWRDSEQTPRW